MEYPQREHCSGEPSCPDNFLILNCSKYNCFTFWVMSSVEKIISSVVSQKG